VLSGSSRETEADEFLGWRERRQSSRHVVGVTIYSSFSKRASIGRGDCRTGEHSDLGDCYTTAPASARLLPENWRNQAGECSRWSRVIATGSVTDPDAAWSLVFCRAAVCSRTRQRVAWYNSAFHHHCSISCWRTSGADI